MKLSLSNSLLIAVGSLVLMLAGCSSDAINRFWGYPTREERAAADDAKCRQYGFTPGTEGYGNCRLQLDQIRATKQAAAASEQVAADIRRQTIVNSP